MRLLGLLNSELEPSVRDSLIGSIWCGELDSFGTIKRQRGAGLCQVSGISALVIQVSCFFPTEIEYLSWLGIGRGSQEL